MITFDEPTVPTAADSPEAKLRAAIEELIAAFSRSSITLKDREAAQAKGLHAVHVFTAAAFAEHIKTRHVGDEPETAKET